MKNEPKNIELKINRPEPIKSSIETGTFNQGSDIQETINAYVADFDV